MASTATGDGIMSAAAGVGTAATGAVAAGGSGVAAATGVGVAPGAVTSGAA
jgi:hypothetical protein